MTRRGKGGEVHGARPRHAEPRPGTSGGLAAGRRPTESQRLRLGKGPEMGQLPAPPHPVPSSPHILQERPQAKRETLIENDCEQSWGGGKRDEEGRAEAEQEVTRGRGSGLPAFTAAPLVRRCWVHPAKQSRVRDEPPAGRAHALPRPTRAEGCAVRDTHFRVSPTCLRGTAWLLKQRGRGRPCGLRHGEARHPHRRRPRGRPPRGRPPETPPAPHKEPWVRLTRPPPDFNVARPSQRDRPSSQASGHVTSIRDSPRKHTRAHAHTYTARGSQSKQQLKGTKPRCP